MDTSRIEPRQCLMHARRLIDAYLADQREADGWRCVICRHSAGGMHCWLEHGGKVYDFTRSSRPLDRARFYKRCDVKQAKDFDALELLKIVWQANWYERDADEEVDNTILYPVDDFVFRTFFGWEGYSS